MPGPEQHNEDFKAKDIVNASDEGLKNLSKELKSGTVDTMKLSANLDKKITDLPDNIKNDLTTTCDRLLKDPSITEAQKQALNKVKGAFGNTIVIGNTGQNRPKFEVNQNGTESAYNKVQGKVFIEKIKTVIDGTEYKNMTIEGKKEIKDAIEHPSIENIASLQKFLLENIKDEAVKNSFRSSSFRKNGVPDGGFGQGTQNALTQYLKEQKQVIELKAKQPEKNTTDETLKERMTEINEDIDGRKLHIRDTVEQGKLKERSVDIQFKFLGDFHFEQKYENGKILSEKLSVVIKDKKLFEKAKAKSMGDEYEINFNDSNMTVDFISKKPNEKKLIPIGNINNQNGETTDKIESIDNIKTMIKLFFIPIDTEEGMNKFFNQEISTNGNETKNNAKNTTTAETRNEGNNIPKEVTELQADINKIPALKNNEAINKLINDINKLENQKNILGNQYTSKLGELEASKTKITNKEESLKQLEAQIKDTKSIDDKFARKSAMDRLSQQKDGLQKDIKNFETKSDNIQEEVDQLALDINEIKTEIADSKDALMSKLEPVQRVYEKNISTIKNNIEKYIKALNGQYTDSQRAILKPDLEKWTKEKASQETLLKATETDQTNLNTLIADLRQENKDNSVDDNLANGKSESKSKTA